MPTMPTSMWPTRHVRRHEAVARDHELLMQRLDRIEDSLLSLSTRLDDFTDAQMTSDRRMTSLSAQERVTTHDVQQSMQTRLDKLELLLFRTSLHDFAKLDEEIHCLRANSHDSAMPTQPDAEISPGQANIICTPPGLQTSPRCLKFDIFSDGSSPTIESEVGDIIPEVTLGAESTLTSRCKIISDRVRDQCCTLHGDDWQRRLDELIMANFHQEFLDCPQMPKTQLDRTSIRAAYDSHDRHYLWRMVCNKYHEGTGDPVSKSDAFLDVMKLVCNRWKEVCSCSKLETT